MENSNSTILIRNRTRERLKHTGHKGQTYDELINNLLDLKNKNKDALDSRLESLQSSAPSSP
jgi:DNA repair protein RadC